MSMFYYINKKWGPRSAKLPRKKEKGLQEPNFITLKGASAPNSLPLTLSPVTI